MARNLCRFVKGDIFYISRCFLNRLVLTRTSSILRLHSPTAKKPEVEAPIYTKTDHEYRWSKKTAIQILESLLNIKPFDALEIVSTNPLFRKASPVLLKKNHILYLQKGITRETMLKYPEILALFDSERKIHEIQRLPYDINIVAILLTLSFTNLNKVVQEECEANQARGKITVMSSLLEIDKQKVCEYIAQKPFLCSLYTRKIDSTIKLLLEFGVTPDDICNDLWVLRYSEQLIKERLTVAKEHNIDTMKTWMVRAKQEVYQTYIKRRSDNKSILGNSSLAEYLSKRLDCSVTLVNYFILKHPALQNKSLKKLKDLIDFLYAEGFKPQHICRVPKILVHSVETTRKRLKQLEDKGIKIDSLSMLTKSQNQFTQLYEALVKSKKLKNKT